MCAIFDANWSKTVDFCMRYQFRKLNPILITILFSVTDGNPIENSGVSQHSGVEYHVSQCYF